MQVRLVIPMAALALLFAAPLHAEDPSANHEFRVTGMTCGLCAKAIEKGLRGVDGVQDVQIDQQAERVVVVARSDLSAAAIESAIEGAGGYEAELLEPPEEG